MEGILILNLSILIFSFDANKGQWEETPTKMIENIYSVTSLSWKLEGSRLALVMEILCREI
jgi:hypothetical protein